MSVAEAIKDAPTPSIAIETVTPDLAAMYLTRNQRNRNISRATVMAYARDMAEGRWLFTADPIQFDDAGRLINGQHRLSAVVEAGVPVKMLVVEGLEPDAMAHLDQGRRRTASDILAIEGYKGGSFVAAAARNLLRMREYKRGESSVLKTRVTASEILEMVRRHPLLVESAQTCWMAKGVRLTNLITVHYAASYLLGKKDAADAFVAVFRYGQAAYPGDPAFLLRERNLQLALKRQPMSRDDGLDALIHAWNGFVRFETFKVFRLPKQKYIPMEGLDVSLI